MSDPEFPPLLTPHDVTPPASPFGTAREAARNHKLGAGDIIWSRDPSNVSLALILEPEIALENTVQMIPLAVVACGDAIAALAPPQVAITYSWPSGILVNAGWIGKIRAASAGAKSPGDIPDWLVLGVDLKLRNDPDASEPGHNAEFTTLDEEGCTKISQTQLISSFGRQFMTWLNKWQSDGFEPIRDAWTFRSHERELATEVSLEYAGERYKGSFEGLDQNGNLLLKTDDGETRCADLMHMLEPLDAQAGS